VCESSSHRPLSQVFSTLSRLKERRAELKASQHPSLQLQPRVGFESPKPNGSHSHSGSQRSNETTTSRASGGLKLSPG
jgi:hypothetical protein